MMASIDCRIEGDMESTKRHLSMCVCVAISGRTKGEESTPEGGPDVERFDEETIHLYCCLVHTAETIILGQTLDPSA